jgi:DNA polymerase IV
MCDTPNGKTAHGPVRAVRTASDQLAGGPNAAIIAKLQVLADLLAIVDPGGFKLAAYNKAIRQLRARPQIAATRGTPAVRPGDIPGIGPGIAAKINEFLTTGNISEIAAMRRHPDYRAYTELSQVLGLGPKNIVALIARGIRTRAELAVAAAAGRVHLTHIQAVGLRYFDDLHQPIPRWEVEAIGKAIIAKLGAARADIAGSYRRGAAQSGDIDILICGRADTDRVVRQLRELAGGQNYSLAVTESKSIRREYVVGPARKSPGKGLTASKSPAGPDTAAPGAVPTMELISTGPTRITFVMLGPSSRMRQVDLLFIPKASYAASLLYFTGSWEFNESMRSWAKAHGFRLNQNGLYKVAAGPTRESSEGVSTRKSSRDKSRGSRRASADGLTLIPTKTEQDIFAKLGLRYMEPAERTGAVIPINLR